MRVKIISYTVGCLYMFLELNSRIYVLKTEVSDNATNIGRVVEIRAFPTVGAGLGDRYQTKQRVVAQSPVYIPSWKI